MPFAGVFGGGPVRVFFGISGKAAVCDPLLSHPATKRVAVTRGRMRRSGR
jgi:hypothetical protein